MADLVTATTWIDIIDDAVKIGLGAAIGACGAIGVNILNHRNTKEVEYSKRRMELIKEIGTKFSAASHQIEQRAFHMMEIACIPVTDVDNTAASQKLLDLYPTDGELDSVVYSLAALLELADHGPIRKDLLEYMKARSQTFVGVRDAIVQKLQNGRAPEECKSQHAKLRVAQKHAAGKVFQALAKAYKEG